MKRLLAISLVALAALLGLSPGTASAQYYRPLGPPNYGPGYRAPLSPYLNLLRGGDPAANYFLGTVPEFERRSNDRVFRSALRELDERERERVVQTAETEGLLTPLPSTGHPTAFMNTASYFGQFTPRTPPPQGAGAPMPKAKR
jgi:hypothetical protein